jgi:addiction module HigA family antidote
MAANEFAPVSPGEMIKHEFLAKYGLSQNQLAKALGISPNRIADIIANRRAGLGLCASRETVRR